MLRMRPRITVTTPPARLPVTLDEIKGNLNLDDDNTGDDPLLMGFVRSAVEHAELFTGRALITRTLTVFYDAWPTVPRDDEMLGEGWVTGPSTWLDQPGPYLELPQPPLISVTHVKTYDDDDDATTFAATSYYVDTVSVPGRIVLRTGASAPSSSRTANGLEVRYDAGYGPNYADVVQPIRDGILHMASYLYEHRGDCVPEKAAHASGAAVMWRPYALMRL